MYIIKEIKLWSLQKNYHSNVNKNLRKIFNNIWFIYACKKKRRSCWYRHYQKKCSIRTLKYQKKLYNRELKKPNKFIFNNIKKKFVKYNIKPWSFFGKQLKKRKTKLTYYQNNFNKLYSRNNMYILLTNHSTINTRIL